MRVVVTFLFLLPGYGCYVCGGDLDGIDIKRLKEKAVIYRTLQDYSDYVPVEMSVDKRRIMSFPEPMNVTENNSPVKLINDYMLDKQGISPSTMFVRIRRGDYSNLPQSPSKTELNEKLMLQSYIVEYIVLPIPLKDALTNIDKVESYIRDNFKGCKIILGHGIEFGDPEFILGTNY